MIEKNIPMPLNLAGIGVETFSKMEVGDSILDAHGTQANPHFSKVYGAATRYGYRTGKKFKGRKVDGGVRVWRAK